MQLPLGSHSFGCWEQSHTIKSDGLGIILLSRQKRTASLFRKRLAMNVMANRKQEVRYRLMPIKWRRNASTRRMADGSWPFYDRHRRLLIVQRAFRPVGHPSKIHFSCSKDNLNVANIQQRDAPLVGLPFKRYLQLPSEQSQGNPLLSSFGCCLP